MLTSELPLAPQLVPRTVLPPRSGNPGYLPGKPVLAGFLGPAQHTVTPDQAAVSVFRPAEAGECR